MPEGCIFSGLMELKENGAAALNRSPGQIYDEIRKTVDTMHADGTLKARIIADLGRFFIPDPGLVPTLQKIRAVGKKLFLLTNSEADYTAAVMNFLVGGEDGSWEDLFDLVICFSRKPGFFLPGKPGIAVQPGTLPLMPNRHGRAFIGGDCFFLEKMLGVGGDEILYFGDHTYGDILSSKKSVGWRTAMIVPEVELEVENLRPLRDQWKEVSQLEEELDFLVLRQDQLETSDHPDQQQLAQLEEAIGDALGQRSRLQKALKAAYNPYWDSLFREGRASSRFGRQTMEFACIYTSRVSNFLNYPADKFFARHLELQPHERWALNYPENNHEPKE
jgi:5'-nucleotidase